jgi:hypothetical protein
MQTMDVDGLLFAFPDSWKVTKYDDWAFYKRQFITMDDGIKAVDLAAFDEQERLWLIEVKDFRRHSRQKDIPLHEEVWKKVYDTLAGLFAAKCNAVNEEQTFARATADARKICVVLHMEQPAHPSKLYPESLNSADVSQQLRIKIKPIDPHPLVMSKTAMPSYLQWSVN